MKTREECIALIKKHALSLAKMCQDDEDGRALREQAVRRQERRGALSWTVYEKGKGPVVIKDEAASEFQFDIDRAQEAIDQLAVLEEESRHAFEMGWSRGRHPVNHATRRQIRKALDTNSLPDFATGWYLYRLFKLLIGGKAM